MSRTAPQLRPVYLAARYSRREELCGYRADLERAGFSVTSRWLNGEHQITDAGLSAGTSAREAWQARVDAHHDGRMHGLCSHAEPRGNCPSYGPPPAESTLGAAGEALVEDDSNQGEDAVALRTRFAHEDWVDLQAADIVVSFTEPPRSAASRGGRHVEFGGALAMGKTCIVVGPRENVFHCLPQVEMHEQWWQALAAMLTAEIARIHNETRVGDVMSMP